jgi:hypothetical protein
MGAYLSNFEPQAVGGDRIGILQIGWPQPAKNLGIESRDGLSVDPCRGISTASRHLASLLSLSQGRWLPALTAYRRLSEPEYLGRLRPEDIRFSKNLRRYVEEVVHQPYQPKTMYAFWRFDERITAERFMQMVEKRSGVKLWMGQQGFGYVICIPAADLEEKRQKQGVIEKETGLQALSVQQQRSPT